MCAPHDTQISFKILIVASVLVLAMGCERGNAHYGLAEYLFLLRVEHCVPGIVCFKRMCAERIVLSFYRMRG